MKSITLPHFSSQQPFEIPEDWLGEIVRLPQIHPAEELNRLIRTSLDNPIGCLRLEEVARQRKRAAVLVDDITRQTPTQILLPPLLERLKKAGIRNENISIVFALGSHRPMSAAEINKKIGSQVASNYTIVNTAASADGEMIFKGVSSSGIPAHIHQAVAEADLRIGLGMITPHMDAGFSGGAKIILPGVCSLQSVDVFHARAADHRENPLGNSQAPLRMELESFVAERVPLDFIFNAILDSGGQIYQCVSGHPIEAHRAGVLFAREVYGAPVQGRYPVVVANCYPYEQDLWQSMKGLWCGDLLTTSGGRLILVAQAPESSRGYPLLPKYIGADPGELKSALDAGQTEDLKAAATGVLVGRIKQRIGISLVSGGIDETEAGVMGMQYFTSIEAAIQSAVSSLPKDQHRGAVGVLTHAGVSLPLSDR